MPDFNSIAEFAAYVNAKISDSLENEVSEVVKETMIEKIKSQVYSLYTPKEYVRLEDQGGLTDPANIEDVMIDTNTLSVRDIRSDIDEHGEYRDVAQIVETGKGFDWNVPKVVTDGRPFTQQTAEEIVTTQVHVQAMAQGLTRNGLTVE